MKIIDQLSGFFEDDVAYEAICLFEDELVAAFIIGLCIFNMVLALNYFNCCSFLDVEDGES